MKSDKKISIIVPIYNAELYINKCINSLINQTKKEIEILLINDGSTDNTEKIIKKYQDKRIRYFNNKNQGIGKTRNFGIKQATGDYLMFIDSDDYLEKEACQKLFEKAEKESLDMVVCDMRRVYDNQIIKEDIISPFKTSCIKDNPSLLNILNLGPCNKIYNSSYIKNNNIKFLENLKYEDVPFVVQAIIKAKKIGQINEPLYNYVIHGNSETTIRDERCFDILKVIDLIRKKCSEGLEKEINQLTIRIITNYTIQQKYQSNKKIANEFIDKAFSYLEENIPDYKDNKYYEKRGLLKRTIEKNKHLTKFYCYFFK